MKLSCQQHAKWINVQSISEAELVKPIPGKKNKKFQNIPSRFTNTDRYVDLLKNEKKKYHDKQKINRKKNDMRCPEFTKLEEEVDQDTTRSTPQRFDFDSMN